MKPSTAIGSRSWLTDASRQWALRQKFERASVPQRSMKFSSSCRDLPRDLALISASRVHRERAETHSARSANADNSVDAATRSGGVVWICAQERRSECENRL